MKLMGKAGFMGLMAIFLSVLAIGGWAGNAAAVTIGTMTGSGTATVNDLGQPTAYSFSGGFAFDNSTQYNLGPPYGLQTLKQIMGDVGQYKFLANSSGNLPAYDYSAPWPSPSPPYPAMPEGYTAGGPTLIGYFQYDLNTTGNGGAHSSLFYGSVLNFAFQGTSSGTVTAVTQSSDGYIHWYYGFDDFAGPPAGMTLLSSLGLSGTAYFNGTYAVTEQIGSTVSYTLAGTFDTVPLPPSMLLLGSGLLGLVGLGWRRRKTS